MPNQFVISIMARDRIGIIADVSNLIKDLQGNLADMSQTVLHGYFTMILVADLPDSVTPDRLRDSLRALDPESPFAVGIQRTTAADPAPEQPLRKDAKYVLTAVGPDQIGLVAAVTEYLRREQINILDLATRVDAGNYTMILLLDLPRSLDLGRLKHDLRVATSAIGVQVELQHHDIFRSTNEI